MLLRPIVVGYRIARKAAAPLVQRVAAKIRERALPTGVASPHPATPVSPDATFHQSIEVEGASPPPNPMRMVSGKHGEILAMLEETARLGHVPCDALIGRLYACHCDKLAQDRQSLAAMELELECHLARLEARFPAPAPEPEKPEPKRIRRFGPISRDLRRTAAFRRETRQ